MTLRFRKSIKLAPGLRMNLSGGGVSWTIGPKGASIGVGRRGTYLNSGIPGTGLLSRQRISGASQAESQDKVRGTTRVEITVSVDDEGSISFKDSSGNLIGEALIEAAKKQQGDKIKALIQGKCDEINAQVEALGRIHEYTTRPGAHSFVATAFSEPRPVAPTEKRPTLIKSFFKVFVSEVENENRRAREQYDAAMLVWETQSREHDRHQRAERDLMDRLNRGDIDSIVEWFEAILQDIAWPQETQVSFEMSAHGVLAVDVDLPEVEDMPKKIAAVPQRGFRLSVKEMRPTEVQKLYMRHVHAVGFRIAGEAFATSPAVTTVVLSAYSQRLDTATGQVGNEYLYSVRIARSDWLRVNFDNLADLDPVQALANFELTRNMSKTGIFKPIEPYSA